MDFGTLLHTAQKNGKSGKSQPARYYSTKFEPPKKEQRSKQLSENIKKFLARKEAEEKAKQEEANRKKGELLALRAQDKKATRRVSVMLKRTKSASQSVLAEAIDRENTSVTLAGPAQPDEDDYGYVSQEAAAFYNKMMEKYSKMTDEPKFNSKKKKKVDINNLTNTRERVKNSLEDLNQTQQKKVKKHINEVDEEVEKEIVKIKPKATAHPPPMNFTEILKIAAKKQHEPIIIEAKPKEEKRLYTKKQKKELEREKEWRDRKEGKLPPLDINKDQILLKLPGKTKTNITNNNNNINCKISDHINNNINKIQNSSGFEIVKKPSNNNNAKFIDNKKSIDLQERKICVNDGVPFKNISAPVSDIRNHQRRFNIDNNKSDTAKRKDDVNVKNFQLVKNYNNSNNNNLNIKEKQHLPKDLKLKEPLPNTIKHKEAIRMGPSPVKRRILDDDDEYDSELDDFIDDGPQEEEDYSRHIKEIFGYDKSKYRYVEDDDDNMESSFAQQMREEVISAKIGIMEDLEDMKMEEDEKRRKALMKKKQKY